MMPEDDSRRALPLWPTDRTPSPGGSGGEPRVLALLGRDDLPEGQVRYVLHPPGHLVVVRLGDEVFALDQVCVHGEASLLLGEVRGGAIRCRAHGYWFDLRTGGCTHPAGERLRQPTWRVERRGERWAILAAPGEATGPRLPGECVVPEAADAAGGPAMRKAP